MPVVSRLGGVICPPPVVIYNLTIYNKTLREENEFLRERKEGGNEFSTFPVCSVENNNRLNKNSIIDAQTRKKQSGIHYITVNDAKRFFLCSRKKRGDGVNIFCYEG